MDENKILLVNLSRGLLGEDNASLLGSLLVTKIQLAAMSRADIPAEQRTPFYLYVDEFQNFATDSFATILSEARKYGLNLTVANQYTAQMAPEVKDAVFGNVGSIVSFRMGADDARSMLRYFEPRFEEYDLVHMHNRHFVISLTINGEKSPAFSAISLNLPPQQADYSAAIVDNSRALYGSSREYVERYINEHYELTESVKGNQSQPAPTAPPRPSGQQPVQVASSQLDPHPTPQAASAVLGGSAPQLHSQVQAPLAQPDARPQGSGTVPAPLSGSRPRSAESATHTADTAPAPPKPKRKRTRSRKRKSPAGSTGTAPAAGEAQSVTSQEKPPTTHHQPVHSAGHDTAGETVIHLR